MGRLPLNEPAPARATLPLEPLAVLAAIGVLLAFCPLAAACNCVIAAVAWVRVRAADGKKRGSRLALAALAANFIIGVAAMLVADRVAKASEVSMIAQVREGVSQLVQGDLDHSAWWHTRTPREIAALRAEIRTRLGRPEVTSVTLTSTEVGMPTRATFRFLLEGEGGTSVGCIESVLSTDPASWLPHVQFVSIRIEAGGADSRSDPIVFPTQSGDGFSSADESPRE